MNDKYLIPLFISGTILLMLFVFFIVIYLVVQKQKQNKYYLEKNRMIFDHQNKILIARTEEQERTMDQMSKEIHDNVGQLLNFTKMNMRVIAKYATDNEQKILIDKAMSLLDQVIKDTHNISHSLNSGFIKANGLISVLEEELECINISKELQCKIEVVGDHKAFDPKKELLIYRIAQEAIHNITKHAKASQLCIKLNYERDDFSMSISDNGIGFGKDKIYELNGIGFQNMLHRAMLLNGSLDIDSVPLGGCTITFRANSSGLKLESNEINKGTTFA